MMYWDGDVSWWGWAVMTIGMVAFWGLIAWLIVTLVRTGDRQTSAPTRRPEDILAERYARGEIDTTEYQQRRDALRGTSATSRT